MKKIVLIILLSLFLLSKAYASDKMTVHFFEEFPNEENLEKLEMIDWNGSIIFIGAKSIDDFKEYEKIVNEINPDIEGAWWPILEKSYWISPWSYPKELENLEKELEDHDQKIKVLLDLELPMLNKRLFIKNLRYFRRNKQTIERLFSSQDELNIEIYTANYPMSNRIEEWFFEKLGVNYPLEKFEHKKIYMVYSSMLKNPNKIKNRMKSVKKDYGDSVEIALGTISTGILGTEKILTASELREDLKFCKENNFNQVTIFRLNGLDKDYLKIIHEFVK